MDEEAVRLAVSAHVRHGETKYDELLTLLKIRESHSLAVAAKQEIYRVAKRYGLKVALVSNSRFVVVAYR